MANILKILMVTGLPAFAAAQSGDRSDSELRRIEISQDFIKRVQAELRADPTLSNNSQNIQISSFNGEVTLAGVVASEAERQAIERDAERAVGINNVINNLEVRSNY